MHFQQCYITANKMCFMGFPLTYLVNQKASCKSLRSLDMPVIHSRLLHCCTRLLHYCILICLYSFLVFCISRPIQRPLWSHPLLLDETPLVLGGTPLVVGGTPLWSHPSLVSKTSLGCKPFLVGGTPLTKVMGGDTADLQINQ